LSIDRLLDDVTGAIVGVFLVTESGGGDQGCQAEDGSRENGPVIMVCFYSKGIVRSEEREKMFTAKAQRAQRNAKERKGTQRNAKERKGRRIDEWDVRWVVGILGFSKVAIVGESRFPSLLFE